MGRTDQPPKPGPDQDVFDVCPVAHTFERVCSKWRLTVLWCLHVYGEQRFNDLQEVTAADSATLSRVLKELEDRDLVSRRLEDRPIATYYELSPRGDSLAAVFDAFEDWAFEYTAPEMPGTDVSD